MTKTASTCFASVTFFCLSLFTQVVEASTSPAIVTLPTDGGLPESISTAGDGTLYIGNADKGGVLRLKSGAAKAESWIAPGAFGSRLISGVLVDNRSHTLWVCSNDRRQPDV